MAFCRSSECPHSDIFLQYIVGVRRLRRTTSLRHYFSFYCRSQETPTDDLTPTFFCNILSESGDSDEQPHSDIFSLYIVGVRRLRRTTSLRHLFTLYCRSQETHCSSECPHSDITFHSIVGVRRLTVRRSVLTPTFFCILLSESGDSDGQDIVGVRRLRRTVLRRTLPIKIKIPKRATQSKRNNVCCVSGSIYGFVSVYVAEF